MALQGPLSIAEILSRLEMLIAEAKDLDDSPSSRNILARNMAVLRDQVETPQASIERRSCTDISVSAAISVMLNLGVYEKMPRDGTAISTAELATAVGHDEDIVVRFMRFLAAAGIVHRAGENTYSHTAYSLIYLEQRAADFLNLSADMIPQQFLIPEYLSTHPDTSLADPLHTLFAWTRGKEGLPMYEVMASTYRGLPFFNRAMAATEALIPITVMFPFAKLDDLPADERVALVDVGGGRGHALLKILEQAPKLKGRAVLQDRPATIGSVKDEEIPGIEGTAMDFYAGQPVKNAHIYYIRRCLHNYADGPCGTILSHISSAMTPALTPTPDARPATRPSPSKLLIAELLVPSSRPVAGDLAPFWLDSLMMTFGGRERTLGEFEQLLAGAGLKVEKVWTDEGGSDQVVLECVRVE